MNTKAQSIFFSTVIAIAASGLFLHGPACANGTGLPRADPESVCLGRQQRMGWSEAEYRTCLDRQNRQASRDVSDLTCAGKICQLRLRRKGEGLYGGGGFSLHLTFDAGQSVIRSDLTDERGHRAGLAQFCGASGCPGKPEWVSGDYRGVSYTPIGNPTTPEFVILRLPRTTLP